MDANVAERVEKLVTPIIESLGYEVVEVEFKRVGKVDTLTIYIYKEEGVTLDDCVRVNDALDAPLEENDVTDGAAYTLNISSPGLDRPIVTDKDFERNLGETVEAIFATPVGRKKQQVGVLIGHTAEVVRLLSKNIEVEVPKSNIKVLRIHLDFK